MKNLFPFLALIVFLIMHLGIYFLLFKRMIKTRFPLLLLKYFLVFNFLGILCYFWGRYYLNIPLSLYFLVSLSIGVAFVLFVVMLIYQPLSLIPYFSKKRRGFFRNIVNIGSGIFAGGYLGWGMIEAGLKPKIEVIELPLSKLPTSFSAVQISDLHIGGLIEKNAVREIVKQTNVLEADVIFLTGDIIDAKISQVSEALQELSNLKAPLGIYFITGNHEYFHNIGELLGTIKSMGIKILENQNILLEKNGEPLINLAGVYDLFGKRIGVLEPNLQEALENRQETLPTILLAHQPKFIFEVKEENQVDLVLSGHTHGGQIFPFRFLVTLDQPYLAGLYQHNAKTQIYVNRGTGFWGPPMRILARAEITYFKFLPAQEKFDESFNAKKV